MFDLQRIIKSMRMPLPNTLKTKDIVNVELNTRLSNSKIKLGYTLNKSTGNSKIKPYFGQRFTAQGKKLSLIFIMSKVDTAKILNIVKS